MSFLSLLNFFCIWIPNFFLIAKPLYEVTKESLDEPLFDPSSLASPIHRSLKVSSECQLSTSQIIPDSFFSLPIPVKDRPWGFYASRLETPGLL